MMKLVEWLVEINKKYQDNHKYYGMLMKREIAQGIYRGKKDTYEKIEDSDLFREHISKTDWYKELKESDIGTQSKSTTPSTEPFSQTDSKKGDKNPTGLSSSKSSTEVKHAKSNK